MKIGINIKHTLANLRKVFHVSRIKSKNIDTELNRNEELQDSNYLDSDVEEIYRLNGGNRIRCVVEANFIVCYDTYTGQVY